MVWRNALFAVYNEEVVPPLDENLVIESAMLGDDAAIYGACENALDGLKL